MTLPYALEPEYQRESLARLEAAQRALASGDEARLRLEWQRSQRISRAVGSMLEEFLAQLELLGENLSALHKLRPSNELERGWYELSLALARREALEAVFAAQPVPGPKSGPLELYRYALAQRAFGQDDDAPKAPNLAALAATRSSLAAPSAETESLRVSVSKLDTLLSLSGELTVAQIRLTDRGRELRQTLRGLEAGQRSWRSRRGDAQQRLQQLEARSREALAAFAALEKRLSQDTSQLRNIAQELEDEVLGARLLPAALLVGPLERLVRDLAAQLGKRARLVVMGMDTEIDRKIIDGMRDPLMHMLRNAMDHGLETPAARAKGGKPVEGTIRLEVSSNGGTVVLGLSDDGAGIDIEAVRRRGLERGLISESQALTDSEVLDLIFEPGFSTAARVSEISGRGVGMDVVREHLRRLGGTVSLSSQRGQGSRFTLRLPAQLATTRVLLLRLGAQTVAIPTAHVERTGRVRRSELGSVGGRSVVLLEGQAVPVTELGALLDTTFDTGEAWQPFVVLHTEDSRLACLVDALLVEQEVVVKRLGYPLDSVPHIVGAAMLGSGELVPILSAQILLERYHLGRVAAMPSQPTADQSSPKGYCVLIVDDSITTRTLERSILESAGFTTRSAVNGAEALELLHREPVDLVLSDVEMPRLDGFSLTEAIRRDGKLAHLPVILVTSLDAPEQRERGAEAGADAYIVKGEFDQAVLLETIGRLL